MKTAVLRLTKKIPPGRDMYEDGGVCMVVMNDPTSQTAMCHPDKKIVLSEQFYFGWRQRGAINDPVGEAMQRMMVLFSRYKYQEATLIVEKEFTEERKEYTLIIKLDSLK